MTEDAFLSTSVGGSVTKDTNPTMIVDNPIIGATALIANSNYPIVGATITIASSSSLVNGPLTPMALVQSHRFW